MSVAELDQSLRYQPRAGLLPELSRQTYDQFYKALREAVLNALDAGASTVHVDFGSVGSSRELLIEDDGSGMSAESFASNFMSLGGSNKSTSPNQFGRIGIGSLALLHYAQQAVVETKAAGTNTLTRAVLTLDWSSLSRMMPVEDVDAGRMETLAYAGPRSDHFTRLRLIGVSDSLVAIVADPSAFYALIDQVRRVLPLPYEGSPLIEALQVNDGEAAGALLDLLAERKNLNVVVSGPWDHRTRLTRRLYGDDRAGAEGWTGPVAGIHKTLTIPGDPARQVVLIGFLAAQKSADPRWSGITARVQDVAVEERTFFDLTTDPGFRKYVTGDVWITGDVDREHLINIDRSTLNRESLDYREVRRYMSARIAKFKSEAVQKSQRSRVLARRLVKGHLATHNLLSAILSAAESMSDRPAIPSSANAPSPMPVALGLTDLLEESEVAWARSSGALAGGFELRGNKESWKPTAHLDERALEPQICFRRARYGMGYVRLGPNASPVVIRNRPRSVLLNLDHPRHLSREPQRFATSVALEVAYLIAQPFNADDMYEVCSDLLSAF